MKLAEKVISILESKSTKEDVEEIFDKMGASITYDSLVHTKETIQDFIDAANKNWLSYRNLEREKINGYDTLVIHDAKVKKGDQKTDVYVLDIGSERLVYK